MKEVLDLNIDDYLFKSQKKGWIFKFSHCKILPLFFHWDCPIVITLIPLKTEKKKMIIADNPDIIDNTING